MPAPTLRQFRSNFEVTGPISSEAGLLVLQGGVAHQVDELASILTVDQAGRLEAGLLARGSVTVFGKRSREELTGPMLGWVTTNSRSRRPVQYRGTEG